MDKVTKVQSINTFMTLNDRLQKEAIHKQAVGKKKQGKNKKKALLDVLAIMITGVILASGFIYGVDNCTTTKVPVIVREAK